MPCWCILSDSPSNNWYQFVAECHKIGHKHINFTIITGDGERYFHIHEKYNDKRERCFTESERIQVCILLIVCVCVCVCVCACVCVTVGVLLLLHVTCT
jgi:hypothetical protein